MSNTEKDFGAPGSSGLEELRGQVQSLQSTLSLALVLMFIFSVCVNIFLFRQATMATGEANQAQAVVNNYLGGGEAQARDIWLKLSTFSTTHPDFAPVISKYNQFIVIHSNAPAMTPPAPKK